MHKNTQMVQQTFGSKPMEYSVSCHRYSAVYCRIRHDLGGQNWSEHFWYIMSRNIIFTISSPGNSSRTLTSHDTFSLNFCGSLLFVLPFQNCCQIPHLQLGLGVPTGLEQGVFYKFEQSNIIFNRCICDHVVRAAQARTNMSLT